MEGLPKLKIKHLLASWATFPPDMRNDTQISIAVIKHFLGEDWPFTHILPDCRTPGILTVHGTVSEKKLAKVRIIDLAESLLNLRKIPGLRDCVRHMRTAKNLEPSLAELHIGKMLYANDWQFRFVAPQGKRGDNYDLQIRYHNQPVCGDVKCKIESTAPNSGAITSTLKGARNQVPDDKPGVFFVKFPQQWMEHGGWEKMTIQGVLDFFAQGSGRVVSVALYAEPIYLIGQMAAQKHTFCEVANPRRRFGLDLDWKFFERWHPPNVGPPNTGSWNAMPPKYIRLFDFPKGLAGHEKE